MNHPLGGAGVNSSRFGQSFSAVSFLISFFLNSPFEVGVHASHFMVVGEHHKILHADDERPQGLPERPTS